MRLHPTLAAVFWLLLLSLAWAPAQAQAQFQTLNSGQVSGETLRVGIYVNPPLIGIDAEGPRGLVIDLLEDAARQEGWKIHYVAASFAELLEMGQNREIDLIAAIAYTPERAQVLQFNREAMLTNWGVIYRHRDVVVDSVLDLAGARIAVKAGDTHARALESLLREFNVQAELHPVADYREVMQLLAHGEVDAAAVNRLVGRQFRVPEGIPTHIIFNPVELHFASARPEMAPVLQAIDRHLRELKTQPGSMYHLSMNRWLGDTGEMPRQLPGWPPVILAGIVLLTLLVIGLALFLRQQIRHHTRALRAQSEALAQEVREREQAQERLNELAYSDSLTHLPNRTLFQDRLHQAMEYAKRHERLIALLFIDLDDFKRVNDSLGHAAGDRLLQEIARRFGRVLRETDTLARLGGDEFTVILTDIQRPEDAVTFVRKLLDTLRAPFMLGEQSITMSASIGITLYPSDDTAEADLLKDADTAMYQAKSRGKNTFDFYAPELTQSVRARLTMEGDLRAALDTNQFLLHYQPIVSLNGAGVQGLEALVRWQHPVRGLVPPDEFIPVAEDSGLIHEIGDWVIDAACAQLAQWDARGLSHLTLAINLSPVQFRRDGLVSRIARRLRQHSIASERLHLEITESLLMEQNRHVAETLQTLDAMGIGLCIDDFGTGYSALNYLRHFPIRQLKVDRSFVEDMLHAEDTRALVRAIVLMAHALRLEVVAEGVEEKSQLELLREMGCDQVQGYLLSRPLPAAEIPGWIESQRLRIVS